MSEERYFVLGTAGHIDHGKTSLIKALTGVDCDRFSEEKERGITIDIGFARYTTPGGTTFGIVDVPGHAKFIRNMVAGAIGLDLIILVIAADDGVMPQTIEHLHIARLLGVRTGLVALTKCDMVDDEIVEIATAEIEELVEPTFLNGCPIIPVSSTTKAGFDDLIAALERTAAELSGQRLGERFRMPVDRSFSIKGAGTVVTGTTQSGTVSLEDELEIMPKGKRARVRSIQVHGEQVKTVGPGHRAAINLAGIDKSEIQRGHMLVEPDSLTATYMFDAEVEILPGNFRPLHAGSECHLHIGTTEAGAKLHPLDCDQLGPEMSALVQLRLSEELALAVGDHFILRSSAADHTIGGGRVLDAHPTKHRRRRTDAAEKLTLLLDADSALNVIHQVGKAPHALERTVLQKRLIAGDAELAAAIAAAQDKDLGLEEHQEGRHVVLTLPENRERIIKTAIKAIGAYHKAHPTLKRGLGVKELAPSITAEGVDQVPGLVADCLQLAVESGALTAAGETYALPGHGVKLGTKDQKAAELIVKRLNLSATPEQPEEFAAELKLDKQRLRDVVEFLVEDGQLVRAPGKLVFGAEQIVRVRERLASHLQDGGELTVSEFSKLVGSSRKYSIPLLQLLENDGMLMRDGDSRRLNPKWRGDAD